MKSYARRGVRGGGLGWGRWVQVRRGRNPRQGGSLDKDKTDSTTTNKQDPQDTPAGRYYSSLHFYSARAASTSGNAIWPPPCSSRGLVNERCIKSNSANLTEWRGAVSRLCFGVWWLLISYWFINIHHTPDGPCAGCLCLPRFTYGTPETQMLSTTPRIRWWWPGRDVPETSVQNHAI